MLTMSDKTQHARRRRVISQAFSEGSMRKFEPILVAKLDRFCQLLRACQEDSDQWTSPLNMASRCKARLTPKLPI